jgi:hypothetical protein
VSGQYDAPIALLRGKSPQFLSNIRLGEARAFRASKGDPTIVQPIAVTAPATEAPRKGAYKYLATLWFVWIRLQLSLASLQNKTKQGMEILSDLWHKCSLLPYLHVLKHYKKGGGVVKSSSFELPQLTVLTALRRCLSRCQQVNTFYFNTADNPNVMQRDQQMARGAVVTRWVWLVVLRCAGPPTVQA